MNGKPNSGSSSFDLHITHLNHVGPYLKIFGQVNRETISLLSKRIEQLLPTCFAIEPSWSLGRQQALLVPGIFCVFKQKYGGAPGDADYMRTRLVSVSIDEQLDDQIQMLAEIEFLDFGYCKTVNSRDLLFPKQPQLLQNVPILCTQYIMLGICAGWEAADFDKVNQLILNHTVHISVEHEISGQKFVNVQWKDFNLAEFLVQQKQIGAPITNELMLEHCKKMWKDSPQPTNNNTHYINNNMQNMSNASKTPTDLAREQLAARRSLAARLEQQRTLPVSMPRQLNAAAPEHIPKQLNAMQLARDKALPASVSLADVTNVIPSTVQARALANIQKPTYMPSNQYTRATFQSNEPILQMSVHNAFTPKTVQRSVNMYSNVRLGKPMLPPSIQPHLHSLSPVRYSPPRTYTPTMPPVLPQSIIPAFKSTSLTIGCTYDVYVSYVENGPHMFWVQLKSATKELETLMGHIERSNLNPMMHSPEVGMACIARFAEDGNCYRALISAIFGNKFRVVYVDYGNSAMVEFRDLFHISLELLDIKPFAFRFKMAGTKELEPIDESIKRLFRESALYRNFHLIVRPAESVGSLQTCYLKDRDGNSMLDVLKKMKNSRKAYATAEHLQNDDSVEIRFIDSPSNFYVQKVSNIGQFDQLMDEMFSYYNTNQVVPEQFILGSPCIVKFEQGWYRAEILRVDSSAIIVRHVDFGYEQSVQRHLISIIAEKHLKMARQAIKCCLKGFENSELGQENITDQFEMLAEESNIRRRTFTVRVFRIEPDGLNVVNLLARNLNVMKKLYKLSMPFEQYLSLEKGQFNPIKAPSAVSPVGTDASVVPLEKANILNSTTVESDDRMQLKRTARNKDAGEWDKHSSSSSRDNRDNRDMRSNSNDQQRNAGTKRQQQHKVERHRAPKLDLSFETQSTGSYASGMSSPRKNRQTGRGQNGKQNANINDRSSPRKEQQQKQNQRSQNAPQGFAQKPLRQKSTLDGSAGLKKSSGIDSDGASSTSTTSKSQNPESYLPLDKAFVLQDVKTPHKDTASISWWVSPFQFYVVFKTAATKYDSLLREMKEFYRQKPNQSLQLKVGSSVVVRHRKDGAILRGTVHACNHMLRKYRVFCVDSGNIITVTSEDLWQVEQRFAEAPCLAHRCTFNSVVSNYDHLYIIDRMEKFVPSNAKVECEFLEKHLKSNTFIVNIFVNGDSLRDMLVKSQFLTQVPPEVRVSLLAGQQIRGKFSSIRDMTNFKIQLECCNTVNFLCSYDDPKFVKANMDLARHFKEFYEGKSVAFNVKDVCENNIIHLRPIMPLFKEDRNTFICGYPIMTNTFKALVVYIAKPYRVYVQPSVIESVMKEMLDNMYDYYEENGKPLLKIEKDQLCAARSKDENWYRARIVAKNANEKEIEVFYLDYGNTEKLSRSDLKVLEEKFYVDKSSYGVEINLPIGRTNNEENLKALLSKLLDEQVVTVNPIETRRNHIIADLILNNNQSVVNALKSEKLIAGRDIDYMRKQLEKDRPHIFEYIETVDLTKDDDDENKKKEKEPNTSQPPKASPKKKKQEPEEKRNKLAEKPKPVAVEQNLKPEPMSAPAVAVEAITKVCTEPQLPTKSLTPPPATPTPAPETETVALPATASPDPYKDMDTVVLSHCDNPAQFFVHYIDKLDTLHRLQENLQIVSPSLPQLMNVVDGAECISLYSVDKQWYRAKIIDAELMVLKFIDYGNTDCVSDASEIKESMWSHIEPFCVPCALPICPKTADWVDAANNIFNDSYNKIIHYEYLTHGDYETRSYVNMYIEGVDVAKKLIADGYAKPLEYVISGSTCYVSHVNGISDFYIQLERDCKALELIEMYLRDAEQHLKPLESFEKSLIVAALFEEDGLWYRAELLRQLPDNRYEVRFIDYGNTSSTPKCLLLSEEIANLPSLSKRCTLELPTDYISWSDEADAKFAEITGEGELVFTTELIRPGVSHVVIHLLLDEDNIIDKLLPLCARKKPEKEVKPKPNASSETSAEEAKNKNAELKACITHLDSPKCVYLQLSDSFSIIEEIALKLNTMKHQVFQEDSQIGELYVAEEGNEFYRVRLLDVPSPKQYRVKFIDYGNQTMVNTLYVLPAEMAQIKELVDVYTLEHCDAFDKNPNLTREALDALVDGCNGDVTLEFVDKTAKPPVVKLTTIGKNELNIFDQLQKLLEVEVQLNSENSGDSECVISHGNSPKSFYVQLKKHSAQLDLIVKTLQGVQSNQLKAVESLSENVSGVCYSQEDNCYYRCLIKQVLGDNKGCEVFLTDYGNTIITKQVYQLLDQIKDILPLALHCKLSEIPAGVEDAKLEEAFTALVEQHFGEVYEIVNEIKDEKNTQHAVQLRIGYKDLAQELINQVAGIQKAVLAELHNCFIVQYNAPTSFYVQMEKDVPALEKMTDKLLDAEQDYEPFTQLQEGALCAALFPEDGVFYRAQIVKLLDGGKCEVHFIDFGNNAVTDQFRQLPEDMIAPARVGKHCELESASIAKCDVADLQAFIDSRFSETFQVEILATEGDTLVVRLFYQSTSISEKLRQHVN
ncbi:maternal protein tudor [Scaptodrosophila lebanonensis]|uniref:Maternal protein tudor n=1 Tax=Drosophila lebanonensis TaxID=7225 RepID=A0A6J2UJF8_DROLE|nr:maternal protein tudor [Scaptodrosophila lebanonensis]